MATLGDKLRDAAAGERKCALEMLARCNRLEELSVKLDQIPGERFSYISTGHLTQIYFTQGIEPTDASQLLRAFVKDTGIRLKKRFKTFNGTFTATSYEPDDPRVAFEDFVPQECRVEPVTRMVPEHEETTYKVVCHPPEAAEATVEPNGAADLTVHEAPSASEAEG